MIAIPIVPMISMKKTSDKQDTAGAKALSISSASNNSLSQMSSLTSKPPAKNHPKLMSSLQLLNKSYLHPHRL